MPDTFNGYHVWLGIPANEQPPNHYRLLGIAIFETDLDVIDHAADRQMAHVRTFQSGRHQALSQQILNELAAARVCLLSLEKKAVYDRDLRSRLGSVPKAAAVLMGQAVPTVQPTATAIPRAAPVASPTVSPVARSTVKPAATAGTLVSNKAKTARVADDDVSLDIDPANDFAPVAMPTFQVREKRRGYRRGPTWQRPAMLGIVAAVAVTTFWLLYVFAVWVSKQNWTWQDLVNPSALEPSTPAVAPSEPHPDTSEPPAPLPAATEPTPDTPEP